MKTLVTGGAGFIGSFLIDRLLAEGQDVVALDNLDKQVHVAGKPDYLPDIEFHLADIRDLAAVKQAINGVDTIIHCAGSVGVGQSMYQVKHYVDVNVTGMATLLQALIESRQSLSKLILVTSMTGYGEGLYRRIADGHLVRPKVRSLDDISAHGWEPRCTETGSKLLAIPTTEHAELRAQNVYALTKRYQEELGMNLSKVYDWPTVSLRLFNVYGPRQSLGNPYTGVLAIFLSRLMANERPLIYEDGCQTRDFISVHDVCRAIILCSRTSAADGEVINIGSGVPRRILDCAQTLCALMGKTHLEPNVPGKYRKGDVRHCYADTNKAETILNFIPKVSWEQGLSELIEYSYAALAPDRFLSAQQELQEHNLVQQL